MEEVLKCKKCKGIIPKDNRYIEYYPLKTRIYCLNCINDESIQNIITTEMRCKDIKCVYMRMRISGKDYVPLKFNGRF